jgi:hypothetical protein
MLSASRGMLRFRKEPPLRAKAKILNSSTEIPVDSIGIKVRNAACRESLSPEVEESAMVITDFLNKG